MPTPLDVFLGEPLAPERQAAIDAVRAAGGEENSMTFWDHAQKVQRICARTEHEPGAVAKALSLIEPYVSPDGEYSRMAIFDSDLDGLTCMVARLVGCPAVTPEERATRIANAVYPPLAPSLVSLIAAAIRAARNEALEQAALAVDDAFNGDYHGKPIVERIRALKHSEHVA